MAGRSYKSVVEKVDFIQAVERSIAVATNPLHPKNICLLKIVNLTNIKISFQGIEKKNAKLKGSEKAVVARHEVGHAVVGTAIAKLLPGQPHVEVSLTSQLSSSSLLS